LYPLISPIRIRAARFFLLSCAILPRWGGYEIYHCFCYRIWGIKRKIWSHSDYNICIERIFPSVQPKRLFEYPFNSVPGNRSFQLSADANSDAAVSTVVGEIDDGEAFAVQPRAVPVYRFEFKVLPQQAIFRKTKLPQ
jgi:hypothetical protein